MSDLARKIRDAALAMKKPKWSAERSEAALRATLEKKRRREIVQRASIIVIGVALIVVPALRWLLSPQRPVASGPAAVPSVASGVAATTADEAIEVGTKITPLTADAVVTRKLVAVDRIEVALKKGGAKFDLADKPARTFRVVVASVVVEAAGGVFEVEPSGDFLARVTVERGSVRVLYAGQTRELGAGESGTFPPLASEAPSSSAAEAKADDAPKTSGGAATPAASAPSWRSLAHDGDFDKAYEALAKEGPSAVRDEPAELLLAADVARLSKHAAQAVDPLRRVVLQHPGDPRAPLAAFTLGRVLLDQLGRAREAADMFAKARALGGGGLGEDALAREVEASSRAGDAERARRLAEEYVAKYPNGQRKRSVVKFGGIE